MNLPRDSNEASSGAGEATPKKEGDVSLKSATRTEGERQTENDDELELAEPVFRSRPSPVPVSLPLPNNGVSAPKVRNRAPARAEEVTENTRKNMRIEKKNAVNLGSSKFNRFGPRPEVALAALPVSESPADFERLPQGGGGIGGDGRSGRGSLTYRPNKLFGVLNSIYLHSPLKWLDTMDRAGPRLIVISVIPLIIMGCVGWIFFQSLKTGRPSSVVEEQVQKLSATERVERATKAVQELFQDFAGAVSVDSRLRWIIAPDQARAKMETYYGQQRGADPKIVSWSVGSSITGPQGDYLPLTIEDSMGTSTTLVMEETVEGVRIDWENFIGYGDQNWQSYCASRPIPPAAMRVQMRKSEHYEGIYSKEKYQAYDMEHRSGPPRLTGYVLLADRVAQSLADLCKDDQWHAANVWLHFEIEAGIVNIVRIDDLTATRWQDQAVKWKRRE